MATDWTSPKTSDTHTNELAATRGRDESNARMDYTGDTNIPDGTIRWNKANNRFEIWNATTSTWSVLSSKYLINVDQVDGYDAGNASGNVPVSNGNVNSNLNADKLDGQHGTYFQARANHTGTQAPSTISPQGAGSGLDADKLDGKDSSDFALAGHTHNYVSKSGDTMTGTLTLQGTSINIQRPEASGGYARGIMFFSKDGSTVEAGIGMRGEGNNPPQTVYMGLGTSPWYPSDGLTVTPTNITFKNNKVWHAGNDGSGSGLDADTLDGKHLSEIGGIWDVIIEDQKPSGTDGGTFTSGAWITRDLNTLVYNYDSLASLNNNRFTLPAGTYCIDWDAPAFYVGSHQSALYNYTTSTIVAYGTSAISSASYASTSSNGTTVITITSPTSFEIRHICGTTINTYGFGKAVNFGTEIYTRVRIKKIG